MLTLNRTTSAGNPALRFESNGQFAGAIYVKVVDGSNKLMFGDPNDKQWTINVTQV